MPCSNTKTVYIKSAPAKKPRYSYKQRKTFRKYKNSYFAGKRAWKHMGEVNPTYTKGQSNSIASLGATWATASPQQRDNRRAFGYYGDGDYRSFFNRFIPRGSFATGGRALGEMTGVPGMGMVGSFLGRKLAGYTGVGDYGPVSTNGIMGGAVGGGQQNISVNQTDMSGDVVVTRTEFLQNVTATIGASGQSPFAVTQFPLNPGMTETFPFLSQIAQNFVLYDFSGLIFSYKPISGENNNVNNGLGKVILATQYDPDAAAFNTSQQMENYDYSNSSKPSVGMQHGVETDNSKQFGNMLYVRTGQSPKDKIFTDTGTLYVATEAVPGTALSTVTVGELWVSYSIRLSRAQLYGTSLGNNIDYDFITFTADNTALVLTATPFVENTLGCVLSNVNATTALITFPANIVQGTYLILIRVSKATSSAAVVAGTLPTTTFIAMKSFGSTAPATSYTASPNVDNSTNNVRIAGHIVVFVNAPGNSQATIQVPITAALTATQNGQLFITQIAESQFF